MKTELEKKIVEWAEDRGIFAEGTPQGQLDKTVEELQELIKAVDEEDIEEIEDAIGDIIVTLVIQAELWGLTASRCLETAYNVISKRKGKMVDGMFVKDVEVQYELPLNDGGELS